MNNCIMHVLPKSGVKIVKENSKLDTKEDFDESQT